MTTNLWIDHPSEHIPKGWLRCEALRAIEILQGGEVERISLNYHLGHTETALTGRDLLMWILGAMSQGFKPPEIEIHCTIPHQRLLLFHVLKDIETLRFHAP